MKRLLIGLILAGLPILSTVPRAQVPSPAPVQAEAQPLAAVRAAHTLSCAAIQAADDWNTEDTHGDLAALHREICRAVAVAILGDSATVSVVNVQGEPAALAGLRSGAVQLVVGVSPSAGLATRFGVAFGPPVYYDTQRFLVLEQSGIKDLAGLRDRLICAMALSKPETVLREQMTARGIPYGLQSHSEIGEMDGAVAVGQCAAGTAMESRLAQSRASFPPSAPKFVFLPERIGLDPVAPAYRYGDQAFGLIVDATVNALVEAEALGITKDNVAAAMQREDTRAGELLGTDAAAAQALGLPHDWAAKVIAATGNYGEIFARTLGRPYGLERGLNALYTQGGLMRPLPMR